MRAFLVRTFPSKKHALLAQIALDHGCKTHGSIGVDLEQKELANLFLRDRITTCRAADRRMLSALGLMSSMLDDMARGLCDQLLRVYSNPSRIYRRLKSYIM
jgi:hypothetical protein